jgi:hypothetical protein
LLNWRGSWVRCTEDEHVGGIVAERDAVFFEGEDDASAQFAEDDVALVGADSELNRVGDSAAFDLVDAEDDGIGDSDVFEGWVVAYLVGDTAKNGDDLIWIGAGVDADIEGGDGVIAREVGDGGDLAVGNDVESAVSVADGCATKGKIFDGAFETGDVDDLSYVVLVFNEDEDAVDDVLKDALGAESDGYTEDAG